MSPLAMPRATCVGIVRKSRPWMLISYSGWATPNVRAASFIGSRKPGKGYSLSQTLMGVFSGGMRISLVSRGGAVFGGQPAHDGDDVVRRRHLQQLGTQPGGVAGLRRVVQHANKMVAQLVGGDGTRGVDVDPGALPPQALGVADLPPELLVRERARQDDLRDPVLQRREDGAGAAVVQDRRTRGQQGVHRDELHDAYVVRDAR